MAGETNLTSAVLDDTIEGIERAGGFASVAPALREPKRVFSYAKLHEEVCRVAAALRRQGLLPGDRVALFMHDGAEMAATLLGTIRAGLCAVPLYDTLRPREVLGALRDSSARAVVAHADLAEHIGLLEPSAPDLKWVFSLGGSRPGHIDFAALCFDVEPHFDPISPAAGLPALLLYETTPDGQLKAYGYPHAVPLSAYESYAASVLRLGPEDRVFSTSRLASSFGLGLNLFFPLRAGAVSFLLPDQVRSRAVFDVLGSFRPTLFCATPTIYNQLVQDYLEMSAPRPVYFQSVRMAISGAEPLPPVLERRLRGVFQLQPVHSFAAAEAFHVVLSNQPHNGLSRSGSCGQPVPGIEARVCNAQGQPVAQAEIGHLELRGAQLWGGTWCATRKALLDGHGGVWVATSNRFFIDEDGFFYDVGRTDGMFKVGGALVSPREIEQTLLGHPAVWECVVTETQDEDGLPLPKAYVVLNVGKDPSVQLAREVMEFVKGLLSPHKAPRAVEFLPQLPRDPDGKVARWRLRSRPPLPPSSGPITTPPRGPGTGTGK